MERFSPHREKNLPLSIPQNPPFHNVSKASVHKNGCLQGHSKQIIIN
jgi:hypothetical protein